MNCPYGVFLKTQRQRQKKAKAWGVENKLKCRITERQNKLVRERDHDTEIVFKEDRQRMRQTENEADRE